MHVTHNTQTFMHNWRRVKIKIFISTWSIKYKIKILMESGKPKQDE